MGKFLERGWNLKSKGFGIRNGFDWVLVLWFINVGIYG